MSIIDRSTIEEMARLGRLRLNDEEITAIVKSVADILNYFSAIQKVDITDVPPADDSTGLRNVARPDTAMPEVLASHQQLLSAAPATERGHIKVKAVF